MPIPPGIDLWLLAEMNPDGVANDVRHNGNGVDLNRNFPHDWTQIGEPGYWEYSGTGPASEPETQAFMAFVDRVQPELTLWYHQDLYRISPSSRRDGPLRVRYAELTGLPVLSVSGGTYTGVAATWVRNTHTPGDVVHRRARPHPVGRRGGRPCAGRPGDQPDGGRRRGLTRPADALAPADAWHAQLGRT